MLSRFIAMSLLLAALHTPAHTTVDEVAIAVKVDPRLELLSTVFRLAGNNEYNQPNSRSPYSEDVRKHFSNFKDHAAIAAARKLREEHGVSFNAVASLAMHVRDWKTLSLDGPKGEWMTRLDSRFTKESASAFLKVVQQFRTESGFDEFFAAHSKLFATVESRMSDLLARKLHSEWFTEFFGSNAGASFTVHPGLLLGGCNYGEGVRLVDAPEEITPCIGCWEYDDDGVPIFPDDVLSTIVHEFCHSYANPVIDAHFADLEKQGDSIFPSVATVMAQQAYATWKIVLYESLVRASVVRYLAKFEDAAAVEKELAEQEQRGFTWVRDLSALLAQFEQQRAKYPNLGAFAPRIAEFYADLATKTSAAAAAAPHVESISPPNGDTAVPPTTTEIVIHFDREMTVGSYSVTGGGDAFPPVDKKRKLGFDASARVFTIPVTLAPDHDYEFGLNNAKFKGFASKGGVPLIPVLVRFHTAAK